jgi:GcrA cell cycle regulator
MTWTEERSDLAAKLWADGLSASQIAARIGGGVSRNAVIGRMHRMKMAPRATSSRKKFRRGDVVSRAQRQAVHAKTQAALGARFGSIHGGAGPVDVVPYVEPTDDQPRQPVKSLLELQPKDCRAPYGDPKKPGFGFCGCSAVPGLPYCQDHADKFYQPATLNERKRLREKVAA